MNEHPDFQQATFVKVSIEDDKAFLQMSMRKRLQRLYEISI